MDVDDCFSKVVGNFGKFQVAIFCFLSTYILSSSGFILLLVFAGEHPTTLKMNNYRVDNDSSILSEWDLLDEKWVVGFLQALFFGGSVIGVVMFGQFSDKFGRRISIIVGYFLLLPICISLSFSSSLSMFAALRFCVGFFSAGVYLVQFIYVQEIVGRTWWTITGAVQNFIFALGVMMLSFGAYFIPAWRRLIIFLTALQIPALLFVFFIPESPRWLYSKGYRSRAERELMLIAKRNGVKHPTCFLKPLDLEDDKPSYSFLDVFRNAITAKRVFVTAFVWLVNSFVYYALTLAAGELGSNVYVSETLSGVIEIPIVFVCPFLLGRRWCGRKMGVAFSLFVAGFSCLILMAFDPNEKTNGKMAIGLLGKMAITFSFNSIYIYTPELFPTCIRNRALGCVAMCGRVGSIASSFAKPSIMLHPMVSYFAIGACGIIAGFLTFLLPETRGCKPPNSFEDLDESKVQSMPEDTANFVSLDSSSFRKKSSDEKRELLQDMDDELEDDTFV